MEIADSVYRLEQAMKLFGRPHPLRTGSDHHAEIEEIQTLTKINDLGPILEDHRVSRII